MSSHDVSLIFALRPNKSVKEKEKNRRDSSESNIRIMILTDLISAKGGP